MLSSLSFGRTTLQVFGLFAAFLLTNLIIYADVLKLDVTMGEGSLTQVSQALMVLGSGVFFALGAQRHAGQRGYLICVATLFLCMFVRENDGLLDNVFHGFWRVPFLVVGTVGAVVVFYHCKTVRPALHMHAQDSSFWMLAIGFLQLVVFSRLFGSSQLWNNVPTEADIELVKKIVQEGSELVGYVLIFFGSYLSYTYAFGTTQRQVPGKG